MPAFRPSRSLLALALVAILIAAGAPISAGAAERGDTGSGVASSLAARESVHDREPARTADPTATAPSALRADTRAEARPHVPRPHPIGIAKATKPATKPATGGTGTTGAPSYRGRNHVWIPALGINRSVTFYGCSSTSYPGNRVYRWGCAGSNNVYLFGHAHSVFRALHDAYVRGRLFKGMKVYYANGAGKVATYSVSWWKLTTPDKGAWAYAAQSTPSLTLQTCVGAQSQYRLIVRLRKVG